MLRYGRPTSPNIDRIAHRGVRFNRYYCADSPCLPSRMGFVSGRFGIHNGVMSNVGPGARFHVRNRDYGGPFRENEMLMRRLRRASCDTVGFSNFPDVHSAVWFSHGWSEFHTPTLGCGATTAEDVNAHALPWLKNNATRDDYLLYITYWDVHRPYKMDASWAGRFADHPVAQPWPDEEAITRYQTITGPFTAQRQFHAGKSKYPLMPDSVSSRSDFEKLVTAYDSAVAYVDYHVGQILDELDRQGMLDDTAIIFSADHGEAFGEHGIYGNHVCADECVHNVPLIVCWPGVTSEGGECDSLGYNVDLAATLCNLLGAEVLEEWTARCSTWLRKRRSSKTP